MQFGISGAPLIFQEAIDQALYGIPYVSAYQDDTLIGAPTKRTPWHFITCRKRETHYLRP